MAHHGLDLVEPEVRFSVADFAAHASDALAGIAERDRLAILVGGTGLYLRAVARGVAFGALPADPSVRMAVDALIEREGIASAAAELGQRAPGLASSTDLRNPRRVARALEVARLAGDVERPAPVGYPGHATWLGLALEPALARDWIASRARAQFGAGLVEEAALLRARHDPGLPAFSAIGYHEAWAVLDGVLSIEAAIELDARRNLAFARRQRTWFRAEPGIEWLDASDPDGALVVALRLARGLMAGGTGGARGARAGGPDYPDPDA